MEPDNITICEALIYFGITKVGQIAGVMAIDYDHARSLVAQVQENNDQRITLGSHQEQPQEGQRAFGDWLRRTLN